jgi:seryl-tRNA synthetase
MLDIRLFRENPDLVRAALRNRSDSAPLDEIIRLDEDYRALLHEAETLRAKRNEVSKKLGKMPEKPPELITEMRQVGEEISALEKRTVELQALLEDHLLRVPNIPDNSVPLGTSAEDNVIERTWGKPPEFDFTPLPHWDLAEKHDIIDFPRGVKLSGTRFYVLKKAGAHLQRALINFMLDLHIFEHGYTEIYPPYMVKKECLVASSNLPKFADNLYHDAEEDYWFIPTAEVPLTNMHRDEILSSEMLPIRYVAYTACFRREKMAAGKDTRGIKRGHQFDKVELYKYCDPAESMKELAGMLHDSEHICQKLNIPYRVLSLCTSDIGFASAKSYDIEMWAPGCNEWLEVSSCSNCTDFQARRANIRYRPDKQARPQYVHTLNGSGLALPRVVIALLENYQQADGSILIPEALQPYTRFDRISSD